jgi:hypothetical protein
MQGNLGKQTVWRKWKMEELQKTLRSSPSSKIVTASRVPNRIGSVPILFGTGFAGKRSRKEEV